MSSSRSQDEQRIKAANLSGRIQSQFTPGRIDPAIGRTYRDAAARGMYDDAARLREFREMQERFRQTRQGLHWAQARMQGRMGRN